MHSSHSKWSGIVMALVSAMLFSTLAIFIKLAYQQQLTVNAIVVLRMTFASVFLWLTILLNRRERARWKIDMADWRSFSFIFIRCWWCSSRTDYMAKGRRCAKSAWR